MNGPAGSGKTTLLAQWFQLLVDRGEHPVLIHANTQQTMDDLRPDLNRHHDGGQAVLFVDDADRLHEDVVEELIAWFEDPDRIGGCLALTGRGPVRADSDRLGLDRLRVLDHRDLSLSERAVAEILCSHCPDLAPDHLRTLVDKLEGWAVGAHLAGQAMRSAPCPGEAAREFSGRNTFVGDYLEAEVFSTLSRRDQQLLVACSVLAELTPDSCTLVTGTRFGAERLTELSRQNALVTEEPGTGTWHWRPMAREFLDAKLRQKPPAEVAELRRRARGWAIARNAYDEAERQAVETGDWNAAVGIALAAGPRLSAQDEPATVLRWLDRFPPSILGNEAGLSVVAALALWAAEGDDARLAIADWLTHAVAVRTGRPPSGTSSAALASSVVFAAFGPDGPSDRIELARSAIEHEAGLSPSWRALALWALGMAAYVDDAPNTARTALTDYLESSAAQGDEHDDWFDPRLTAGAIGTLALIELDSGNVDQADVLLAASRLHSGSDGPCSASVGTVELASVRRTLNAGAGDEALGVLTRLGAHAMLHEVRVLALLELAQAYANLSMPSHQQQSLADADRLLRAMTSPGRLLAGRRNAADLRPEVANDGAVGDSALTERELDVLRLLDSDLSRRQIAERLLLAHNTVKTYVQRLYRKLGVSSRAAAVARGRERGWIP
ncbi:MAG: LuxR C-terminal-related transcriptional regulator [Acidimicrobiales bacterium]